MNIPAADSGSGAASSRVRVLLILVVVYTFNFIDRQIVGILAVPIKADLGLSDAQLGLMGGLAFALLYTGLGIPVAMLADRVSRTWIMTAALTIWSAMTALCGLANSFGQLFLARVGVGIGEAGGVAPAYSLIADYFPPHQRARAMGIYSFGVPLGSAFGIVLGGVIASRVDWRFAFFAVGLAGILVAPVFRMMVPEPPRGRFDPPRGHAAPPAFGAILRVLAGKPTFWLISLGAASSSMAGYGLFFWLPSLFVRSHGLSLLDASLYFGAILLLGGVAGIWAGGWLADRFGAGRRRRYAIIPALAWLVTAPFYLLGILSPSLVFTFVVLIVPTGLGLAWLGPTISMVQHLVRPEMRATASAIYLFLLNLIGIGVGTWAIGALSDALTGRYGEHALKYSILAATGFYFVAAGLFLLASRSVERDWEG